MRCPEAAPLSVVAEVHGRSSALLRARRGQSRPRIFATSPVTYSVPSDRMEQRDAPFCPLKEKDGDSAMPATITVEEAQSRLKEVIAMLAPGEEVVITDNRRPVAKL